MFDSDYRFAVELMKVGLDTREERLTEMVLESLGEDFRIDQGLSLYSNYQRILGKVERSANKFKY